MHRSSAYGPLSIAYDETVLRPRPWTFTQAEWASELLRDAPAGRVLELCCGAGQIGLATAALSGRDVTLVDASTEACKFAQLNADVAGLEGATDVRHGLMDEVLGDDEKFALVLADPPYLPTPHVRRFPRDPVHAIDGGDDGLSLARTCLAIAARHTDLGTSVLLQLRDPAQSEVLARELHHSSLAPVETRVLDPRGAVLHLRRI